MIPRARNIEGITPRLPLQSGWLISDTNTPMLGWVELLARKLTLEPASSRLKHDDEDEGGPMGGDGRWHDMAAMEPCGAARMRGSDGM